MNKHKLIKKLSKELWDKLGWGFGTTLEEEHRDLFENTAEDIIKLLIEQDLLKDNKAYYLEFKGYGDWRCPKCGKHFGGYFEANYCSDCGIKFNKEK